jgi:hypothetical protein
MSDHKDLLAAARDALNFMDALAANGMPMKDRFDNDVQQNLRNALVKLSTEKAREPHVTNRQRLDSAFRALRKLGYIARRNFSCCGGCASYELGTMLDEDESKIGAVYYHQQDAEHLQRGAESVYLGYGGRSKVDGEEVSDRLQDVVGRMVGRDIVATLHAYGLSSEWDGEVSTRIKVLLPGGIDGAQ